MTMEYLDTEQEHPPLNEPVHAQPVIDDGLVFWLDESRQAAEVAERFKALHPQTTQSTRY